MTCKDCIHERVCWALIEDGLPYMDEDYPAEAFCMTFKNKSETYCKHCPKCGARMTKGDNKQ